MNKDQVFNQALELTFREVEKIGKKKTATDADREYLLRVLRETKVDKQELDISWASDLSDEDLLKMLDNKKVDDDE